MDNFYNKPPVIIPNAAPSRLDRFSNLIRSPLVLMVSAAVLITAIVAIIVLSNKPSYPVSTNSRVVIDNLATLLPDMPEEYQDAVNAELYSRIASDSGPNLAIPASGANIREGSLNAFSVNDNLHVGDFIVDIPSLGYSYILSYWYGILDDLQIEPDSSVASYCITENQMAYAESPLDYCFSTLDFKPSDPLTYILPYETDDFRLYSFYSSDSYGVIISYNIPESELVNGIIKSDRAKVLNEEAISRAKDYLKSQGLDPEKYTYHFESEGEAL